MRIAPGLKHAAGGVDGIEAVFCVGGEGAAEGLQLPDELRAGLVGLVLKDGAAEVSVQLDVAVVRCG